MQLTLDPGLLVYFQGRLCPLGEARVGLLTHALHYGTAVFEGIRGYWSAEQEELYLFRPEDHYDRWRRNARILKMEIPLTARELAELTAELAARNNFRTDIYVRPLVYKSRQGIGVHFDAEMDFALAAVPFGAYIDSTNGLRVAVSSWRRVEDNAIPARGKISGAYVNSALAADEARASGFDDAIVLNEDGHVAEGAAANLFLVRQGRLVTPPVYDNILEGITRATVMELARDLLIETVERRVDRSELYVADEVFLAGTAYEIAPVVEIDGRRVGAGKTGALTARLQDFYSEVTHGTTGWGRHWRLPVYHRVLAERPR